MGDSAYFNYNFALMPIPMLTRMTFMTVPSVVTMYAAVMYYSDFLRSQSVQFYDPFHYEEFDFIVGQSSFNNLTSLHRMIRSRVHYFLGNFILDFSGRRFGRGSCSEPVRFISSSSHDYKFGHYICYYFLGCPGGIECFCLRVEVR